MFINKNNKPFLIAEISSNHNGNINNALKLIDLAKKSKADAVKLQTFLPEKMTLNFKSELFKIKNGNWKNYYLFDLYKKAQTPLSWHKKLFDYAKKRRIKIFSTPFDEQSVDFLEKLNCPMYKIASFEMTDIPLVKKIAKTKKPLIISTGLSNLDEIDKTFKIAKKFGAKKIALLYCVSSYPAKPSEFNLNNIKILKERYNCTIGLSDHSNDYEIAQNAIACGAEIIEKHIALKNQKQGLDIKFSTKGNELKLFREKIDKSHNLLGKKKFFRAKSELVNIQFRRSIFAIKTINKNEKLSLNNIGRIRPGFGISPIYFEKLINKKSPFLIKKGQPLKISILKKLKIK
tara:strand:- start:329 stop:1366 length:1038 start_codon:yes stop_codon:yes gene_type:complete